MEKYNLVRKLILAAVLFVLALSNVYAVPTEPTGPQRITRSDDERYTASAYPPAIIQATAGNVTQLQITSLTQTQTWQGYYGEISGTITLDDADNFTMYDWYAAEPQGKIFAASEIVTSWYTIHCFNYSNNGTSRNYSYDGGSKWTVTTDVLNLSELEGGSEVWSLGLMPGDYDGVDETFNESGTIITSRNGSTFVYEPHTSFFVGSINISQGSCPATNTYEAKCVNKTDPDEQDQLVVTSFLTIPNATDPVHSNKTPCEIYAIGPDLLNNLTIWNESNLTGQSFKMDGTEEDSNFQEVLLTVNNSETIIYTTLIENRRVDNDTAIIGFDNETHDFQLIVGDDGHPGPKQDTTTPYYFYVELE